MEAALIQVIAADTGGRQAGVVAPDEQVAALAQRIGGHAAREQVGEILRPPATSRQLPVDDDRLTVRLEEDVVEPEVVVHECLGAFGATPKYRRPVRGELLDGVEDTRRDTTLVALAQCRHAAGDQLGEHGAEDRVGPGDQPAGIAARRPGLPEGAVQVGQPVDEALGVGPVEAGDLVAHPQAPQVLEQHGLFLIPVSRVVAAGQADGQGAGQFAVHEALACEQPHGRIHHPLDLAGPRRLGDDRRQSGCPRRLVGQ